MFYIPDFLTAEEETAMLAEAACAPPEKWTNLSGRRLQNWGGIPLPSGLTQVEALPPWLTATIDRVVTGGIFPAGTRPNHVLLNTYLPGEGMLTV